MTGKTAKGQSVLVVLCVISILLFSAPASCVPDDSLMAAASKALEAKRELRTYTAKAGELNPKLSPKAMIAVGQVKSSIRQVVRNYMRAAVQKGAIDPLSIQADLNHIVGNSESNAGEDDLRDHMSFSVSLAPGARQLLQVLVSFGIECGSDSLLMIFQQQKAEWKEVLNWTGSRYPTISGAVGVPSYQVAPPDARGHWYALISYTPLRCSSCWGIVRYVVLRPGADPNRPRLIFNDWASSYDCDDSPEITAKSNSFELRFEGNSITENLTRTHVRRYEIRSDKVTRLPPMTEDAVEFVEDWIDAEWPEAERWTNSETAARLRAKHSGLHRFANRFEMTEEQNSRGDFRLVRGKTVQLNDEKQLHSLLFLLRQDGKQFEVVDIQD
jgi:hypothetical protein